MRKSNKKLLQILACTSALAGGAVVVATTKLPALTVKADTNSVAARSYGVDVASYQSNSMNQVAQNGGQFAIVKVSEGTTYRNPKASAQIQSAIANNMMPMAYHFATFGANSTAAASEAQYAISSAKATGLPAGSYIACDWETGDGNNVNGGRDASANAILAFMDQIKAAGYQPLLYSGASLLNNNINTSTILNKYPNSLWVASYAVSGRVDTANFNYFPSMDGVAIWQFTDNWRGLSVDGNITLLPLSMNSTSTQAPSSSSNNNTTNNSATTNINNAASSSSNNTSSNDEVKTSKTIMHKAYVYDKNGNRNGTTSYSAYQQVTVLGGMVRINGTNYYKIGDNQYINVSNIDGRRRVTTHNAYVYNSRGNRVYVSTIKRGMSVTTYGSSFKINGKSYYRIGRNRYIKVANFN